MPNNPGGGFAGPGSHKGSFYEDEEGWFEAMLENIAENKKSIALLIA